MTIPTITPLPQAPQVTDAPSVFSQRANTFVAALGQLVTETNATTAEINQALAGALVLFDAYEGDWEAGSYGAGDVVRKDDVFYVSLVDSNTQEPPGNQWQELLTAAATTYDNTESGLDATDVQAAIDEVQAKLLAPLQNRTYSVKTSTQSVTSTSLNFFEITGFSPTLSITIPAGRAGAAIEIVAVISFDGIHTTENDVGFEFALTTAAQTGGASTITAIARASYEYEVSGAVNANNLLFGTATLRARLTPGSGTHTYKLFARNRRALAPSTLNIRGDAVEQNTTVSIQELP